PLGAVAATIGYNSATNTATITPNAPLANSTTYTAGLGTGVKAADGVALASAVSWSFTTVNGAPAVTATTPANNATGVAITSAPPSRRPTASRSPPRSPGASRPSTRRRR